MALCSAPLGLEADCVPAASRGSCRCGLLLNGQIAAEGTEGFDVDTVMVGVLVFVHAALEPLMIMMLPLSEGHVPACRHGAFQPYKRRERRMAINTNNHNVSSPDAYNISNLWSAPFLQH